MTGPVNVQPPAVESAGAPLPAASRRSRRWVVLLIGVAVIGAASWFGGRHLWAAHHLRAAEEKLGSYDFPEALDHLERCLRVWPNSASIRLLAARTARRADLPDRAEEHLSACEATGVTQETALERAMSRAQQGDLPEVEMPLQRLIREGHADASLFIEALVRGYLRVFRFGHALAALDDLIKRQPNHPWAYFWRGSAFEHANRIPEAVSAYRHAVELAPRRAVFRRSLALALVQSNRAAEAWPHFEALLDQSSADADVLLGAARCLRGLTQPGRAIELLDALLRDHPDHSEAWAERGLACSDQGDSAEACRCLRRAFELEPRSYTVGFALFTELRGQDRAREADAVWQRIQVLKRDQERIQDLMTKLGQKEQSADLRCEIGKICLRQKADTAALRWFSGALLDDPTHRPTHRALADYYERRGDAAAAAYHREQAAR